MFPTPTFSSIQNAKYLQVKGAGRGGGGGEGITTYIHRDKSSVVRENSLTT